MNEPTYLQRAEYYLYEMAMSLKKTPDWELDMFFLEKREDDLVMILSGYGQGLH